jgi:hypothetical protein
MATLAQILTDISDKAMKEPAFFRQLSQNPEKALSEYGFILTVEQKEELALVFRQALDTHLRDLPEFLRERQMAGLLPPIDWVLWIARYTEKSR